MADLQQIVGAVLRDLAKARFGADLYSRSIARYYENDFLLRRFPVPRADIEEVEIDLKFSIAAVTTSDAQTEGVEVNAAVVFERAVERLVSTFLTMAGDREAQNTALRDTRSTYISAGFGSTGLRIEMRQKVLRYFIETYTDLIDDTGRFDSAKALANLERPFRWAMENFAHDAYREDGDRIREMKGALFDLIQPVIQSDAIKTAVEAIGAPIKEIWERYRDARLEVMVEGGQLAQLGEAAISSVKIKAVVRNMVWTEVKVGDRDTRHALTAE